MYPISNTDVIKQGFKKLASIKYQSKITSVFWFAVKKKKFIENSGNRDSIRFPMINITVSNIMSYNIFFPKGNIMRHNKLNTNTRTSHSTEKVHSHSETACTETNNIWNGVQIKLLTTHKQITQSKVNESLDQKLTKSTMVTEYNPQFHSANKTSTGLQRG